MVDSVTFPSLKLYHVHLAFVSVDTQPDLLPVDILSFSFEMPSQMVHRGLYATPIHALRTILPILQKALGSTAEHIAQACLAPTIRTVLVKIFQGGEYPQ